MPFQIAGFKVGDRSYRLPENKQSGANRISVIVGPNGVGKTNLLAEMVYQFTDRKRISDKELSSFIRIKSKQKQREYPKRVIAQTFSPFSRFPKERSRAIGLRDYLIDGDEQYATIGFTRGMGLHGSVSRITIGRIIRKLFIQPDHAVPLSQAMLALGFFPTLTLGFRDSSSLRNPDFSSPEKIQEAIAKYLSGIKDKSNRPTALSFNERKLVREFNNESEAELAERIEKSMLMLQGFLQERIGPSRKEYVFDIKLDNPRQQAELLESVLTLNRLGLMRISSCLLRPNGNSGQWSTNNDQYPGMIDIADASSGQQQLLSSLFGVVAEAEDHSLILIDEPELSLHPAWQTQFIDLLVDALSGIRGCHVFIATHSALVAQRAQELHLDIVSIGSEPLELSPKESNAISVDQMLLETFGIAVRDSAYVSKLLMALVMDAEESLELKIEAKKKLTVIKNLYDKAAIKDMAMNTLIDSAIEIVNENE